MNQRGVFITFMVFLLVASVLAAHEASKQTDFRQERADIEGAAFNVVNNAFNNFYEEVVSLNKEGYAKTVQQRPMPFRYDFNGSSIILSQRIPIRASQVKAYVDALNLYTVFANSETGEGELDIAADSIKNSQWDPSEPLYPDLTYAILPQCLLYDVNITNGDANYMILKELGDGEHNCVGGFDYGSLEIVDVNIVIFTRDCELGEISGNLDGVVEEFDPASPYPYLWVRIHERNVNCPGDALDCPITQVDSGEVVIRKHFNPNDTDALDVSSLKIKCQPEGELMHDWLRVKVGRDESDADDPFPFVARNTLENKPVDIDLNLTFDEKVDLFYFTGFSISVNKNNFPVKRST